ncbi:MAG: 3'-5' exonuclease [Proteobacteria bacterium]|nr:3'-5' exonuclease [Pseudomonadota bacterium]
MDYGLVLDLETTGIDAETDRIIEIGLIEFGVGASGKPEILNMYGGLEDPQQPLTPELQKLTGLHDEILKGQSIDWAMVRNFLERASIIVAHNAQFDRSFLQKRPEVLGFDRHWACSMKHIDWEAKGFRTRALNYLAADHGFVNSFAHRALFDCATTFRLVEPYFTELVQRSYLRELRVLATRAPFEMKDKLRQARYRWDNERRVWFKDILEDMLATERNFLMDEVYKGMQDLHQEENLSPA